MCSFCGEAAFQAGNYSASDPALANQATGLNNASVGGSNNIDGLLSGYSWGSTALTWRIPATASDYDSNPYLTGIQYEDQARISTWLAPTATMTTATAYILNEQFAAVSQLTFTAVAGNNKSADLTIGRASSTTDFQTAYAHYPWGPGAGLSGDSWFSSTYDTWGTASSYATPTMGGYNFYTYLHEFGHNMGLKHGHETGGVNNVAMNADRDSMEFSVMTYRSHIGSNPAGGATNERWGFAQSLMMYDIAALQVMYGANFSENATASVYTFSATTGEMFINGVGEGTPGGNKIFRTIWDGNGIDTYNLSNYTTNLNIDLTPGGWSVFSTAQLANLGEGFTARGNLFNALQFNGDVRSLIENAIGGSGNDTITGNVSDNSLYGGLGSDIITGAGGNDLIFGGSSVNDTADLADDLRGGNGNDVIHGNGGNDAVYGGADADTVYGGGGNDTIYGGNGVNDAADHADDLRGQSGNDIIYGNGGDDTIYGGLDSDIIYGDEGNDLIYGGNIAADAADFADSIYGGAGIDTIHGNGGDDFIYGGAAADIVYGGGGNDTIFGNTTATDTVFENDVLRGQSGNDTIYGGGGDDNIIGGIGNDLLYGGLGNDILTGSADVDRFVFDTTLSAATNVDTILDFVSGTDKIVLSQSIFGALALTPGFTANEFQLGNSNTSSDNDNYIIYNQSTGQLLYDADANGTNSQAVLFATVTTGAALTIADFVMV